MSRWNRAMRRALLLSIALGASVAWAGQDGQGQNGQGSQGSSTSVPLFDPALAVGAAVLVAGGGAWIAKRRRR